MEKYIKHLVICFLAFTIVLVLLPGATSGGNSITVQNMVQGITSTDLVNKILGADSGLVVSNISTTGDGRAAGIFDNANLMGFETGIVISSGNVSVIPNIYTELASTALNYPGDNDLNDTTGGKTYDAFLLEFDFIPEGDGVFFQYRFTSDERFTDKYDDAFALYVNGENIALLPNGSRVSIFTIKHGPYYEPGPLGTIFDNNDGSGGYSIILNATAIVTQNEVNHMKFAIADLGDSSYDSASFIAGGTFTVNTAPTVNNSIPDQTAFVDQAFAYAFSSNTFNDSDGDDLTYTARQSNDTPLPDWIALTSDTRAFNGTPSDSNSGTIEIKVTADDGKGGSCNDTFTLTVLSILNDAPNITSYAPESAVNDTYGTWGIFNISVDQTANVTWYLDETSQHTNESVTEANYTILANDIREHNVSALAKNANGSHMQTWVWNVTGENMLPAITIDAPTQSSPADRIGGEQFWVNFTYTELYPANYTITIGNATVVINLTTNVSLISGTNRTVNASFYLNASAADGWYNVTVEMYDNSSNHNISYQNYSIEKGSYNASILQPENQTTNPNVNATYTLTITNTGSFAGTFALAVTNHNDADLVTLNQTTITNLASGSSQNVTLNVTDANAGQYNITVNVTSTESGNEVAKTGYTMTTVRGPTLSLGSIADITSNWGRSFNLNHSVTVTNATTSNANVTYNVSWILGNNTMGTIAKDGVKWHNQSFSNNTVQNITVKVDATSTSGSAINDSKTFSINITRRNIEITSQSITPQSVILDQTLHINASANDEYEDNLICKADLVREGKIIENQTVTNGNVHFSTTEPSPGTFNFSVRFYNTTHYNNETTINCTVSITDITPPIITNVTNKIPTSDSVTITWNTDKSSDSLVRYGTSTGIYNLIKSSATMVTSHTVTLTELSHNTVYYYVVNSTDKYNNSNESTEYNFTTKCTYGTISGLVTDSSTGHPIHNATVSTEGMTIYTWTDGTYTIQSIAPGTYTLNVTASGYLWNNSTVVTVSSGLISRANVTLTPEKVKLALHNSETTSIKSAPNATQVIFKLSATNYGTNATFTITNTSDATIVAGCSSFILNSSESKDFNITATNQTAGYYPINITVTNSSLSKSASVTFYAIMQNMSANYTTKGSCTVNTTNSASVTGSSMLVNSTVDTGANVNDSTLVNANVTGGANVTGESLVQYSNITGSGSVVGNGSMVEHSSVDNSTMSKGTISRNSIVIDSALDNTTLTDSGLHGNTIITDSTVVNVTANKSTIIGVEIDTGYSITLTNVTVRASTSSGKGGRPEIRGGTNAKVITRGVNFTNIYTDVLIEDLVLQYIGNNTAQKNTSMTINASNTVKCDLTVNMTEPASLNITETGINPDGEGTDSILSEDTLEWVPVGSFIYIQHNASGEGNFTIRRYYDPSLNYSEVYIYYYNTTSNPNEWERKTTTANGTKGGLKWIEAVVNHLSTFVLMGTLGDNDDDSGSSSVTNTKGRSNRRYIKPAPTVLATQVPTDVSVSGDMTASGRIETEDDEAFGHGVDTGTDESTSSQTGSKGMMLLGLVGVIVGVIIIVLVIRRKNESENE